MLIKSRNGESRLIRCYQRIIILPGRVSGKVCQTCVRFIQRLTWVSMLCSFACVPVVQADNGKTQANSGKTDAPRIPAIDCLVEPNQSMNLSTAVTGVIEAVLVERGSFVSKGQEVARLIANVEKAVVTLTEEQAGFDGDIELRTEDLEFAQRNKKRIDDLYRKNSASFRDKDEADTREAIARLELVKARHQKLMSMLEYAEAVANLGQHQIFSPIEGVVTKKFLSRGEYVENTPIVAVAEINPLRIEVVMPARYFGRIKEGDQAQIELETGYHESLTAEVNMVDKIIDGASGVFIVRLSLPNEGYKIPSGLRCQAVFTGPKDNNSSAQPKNRD